MSARQEKITFADMRAAGVRGVLVYCSDYKWSHSIALMADRWPDDARLSDIEPRFVCKACGKRGADVRPDFKWNVTRPIEGMGYRRYRPKEPPLVTIDWSKNRVRCDFRGPC